jgi:hypothetical protein
MQSNLDYLKNRNKHQQFDSFDSTLIKSSNPNVIYIANESGLSKIEFELIQE